MLIYLSKYCCNLFEVSFWNTHIFFSNKKNICQSECKINKNIIKLYRIIIPHSSHNYTKTRKVDIISLLTHFFRKALRNLFRSPIIICISLIWYRYVKKIFRVLIYDWFWSENNSIYLLEKIIIKFTIHRMLKHWSKNWSNIVRNI